MTLYSQSLYRHDIDITMTIRVLKPPTRSKLIILKAGKLVGKVIVEVVSNTLSTPLRVKVMLVLSVDNVNSKLVKDIRVSKESNTDIRSKKLGESIVTVDKKLIIVKVIKKEIVSTIKELDIV